MKEIIESLLFASDEPLAIREIIEILTVLESTELPRRITSDLVLEHIEKINEEYRASGRAMHIVKLAGGYQFATLPQFSAWLGRMVKEKSKRKLSSSALETLAVIAYKQPVTKPEIEAIRGVNADYVLKSLMERGMVSMIGRAATPGRPLLYGTTREFLKHFGINDLSDLPKPREIDELMAEAEFEVEKQLLREMEAKKAESLSDEDGGIGITEDVRFTDYEEDVASDPDVPATGPID